MARYDQIDRRDLQLMLDSLSYVIERYRGKDDVMCQYLAENLKTVETHLRNERMGDGDDVASQIEFVLDFLGGPSGQDGNTPCS